MGSEHWVSPELARSNMDQHCPSGRDTACLGPWVVCREKLKAMEKYVEEAEVRTAVMQAEWLEAHDAEMIALRHHVDYLATMIKVGLCTCLGACRHCIYNPATRFFGATREE